MVFLLLLLLFVFTIICLLNFTEYCTYFRDKLRPREIEIISSRSQWLTGDEAWIPCPGPQMRSVDEHIIFS